MPLWIFSNQKEAKLLGYLGLKTKFENSKLRYQGEPEGVFTLLNKV
jgi:hypothetical protein